MSQAKRNELIHQAEYYMNHGYRPSNDDDATAPDVTVGLDLAVGAGCDEEGNAEVRITGGVYCGRRPR